MRKMFVRLVLILLVILSIAGPVLACKPNPPDPKPKPTPKPSYKDCQDYGYGFGFRVKGARNGTYRLTNRDGRLTGGAPEDPDNNIKISNSNSRKFDWKASLGIDAVIINAGGKSTIKKLDEKTSGSGYQGATGSNKKPYEIDEIHFCYDYELDVDTSAKGTFTNEAVWEITKTVDVAEQALFAGETADFHYTVDVKNTAGGAASGFQVVTEVKIKNNTPLSIKIKEIKDVLSPWNKKVKLDCGVRLPYTLKPGRTLTCTATTEVSSKRDGENKVWVDASSVEDGYAEARIEWSGNGSGVSASQVTVTDTNAAFGGPYTVTGNKAWDYTVSLSCPTDEAAYTNGVYTTSLDNTATIVETNQSASQSVYLTCYAPTVSAAAQGTYDVAYTWAITKTSPVTKIKIPVNETAPVNYSVGVSVASRTESNVQLNGSVVVGNPHPSQAMEVQVTDEIAPGIFAELDCANPVQVPAGGSVTCSYTAAIAEKPAGENTAVVTFKGLTFTRKVAFEGTAVNEIDECVYVYDTAFQEPMGMVCANEQPKTYNYDVAIGPYADCYNTDYSNMAFFVTNDTGSYGDAIWQVLVDVDCGLAENCTLTRGYWIAYSNPGVEGYLTTWDEVGGPGAPFLGTGTTWIGMLSAEAGADPYKLLAHEFIVGKLNVLYGAEPTPTLLGTLDHAEGLLVQYEGAQDTVAESPDLQDFGYTTGLIRDFNIGLTGPGVCPDCTIE